MEQPTKKIDQEAYSSILLALQFEPDLVSNTYTKQLFENYESEQELLSTQQSPQTGRGNPKGTATEKEGKTKRQTKKCQPEKKVVLCLPREKL